MTDQEIIIQNAKPDDWTDIAALLQQTNLPLIGAETHLSGFLLARQENRLVGCAGLERYGNEALLRSVAVAASARGKGLGQLLVQQLLNQARQEGLCQVILLTETASGFFPRFGFRTISRIDVPKPVLASAEFQSNVCSEAATVMRLELAKGLSENTKFWAKS